MKKILILFLGLLTMSVVSCQASNFQVDNVLFLVDDDVGNQPSFDVLLKNNGTSYQSYLIEEHPNEIITSNFLLSPSYILLDGVDLESTNLGSHWEFNIDIITKTPIATNNFTKLLSDDGGLLSLFYYRNSKTFLNYT
tara:strand:+ start:9798 stop:10211 length:414 start_codon:yes stop_codon:yes gene_type:complete